MLNGFFHIAWYAILLMMLSTAKLQAMATVLPDTLPGYYTSEYQTTMKQALRFQMQADSFQRIVEARTASLPTAAEKDKAGIRIAIRDHNAQMLALQKQADTWFVNTSKIENMPEQTKATPPVIEPKAVLIAAAATSMPPMKDGMAEFSILAHAPYTVENPIPDIQPLPDGLLYKIQLGAFSKPVASDKFGGVTPIAKEKLANGVTKYYAGLFGRYTQADDALRKIHAYGYKDAFIIAFHNKKVMSVARAMQLENN